MRDCCAEILELAELPEPGYPCGPNVATREKKQVGSWRLEKRAARPLPLPVPG